MDGDDGLFFDSVFGETFACYGFHTGRGLKLETRAGDGENLRRRVRVVCDQSEDIFFFF